MASSILIIEDDPTSRKLLLKIVSKLGITADTAEDGAEGIQKILTNNYKVVLLDLMMPAVSGYEVINLIEHLRSRGLISSALNIIVQTAVSDIKQLGELTKNECVAAVVNKPLNAVNIMNLISIFTGHTALEPDLSDNIKLA